MNLFEILISLLLMIQSILIFVFKKKIESDIKHIEFTQNSTYTKQIEIITEFYRQANSLERHLEQSIRPEEFSNDFF